MRLYMCGFCYSRLSFGLLRNIHIFIHKKKICVNNKRSIESHVRFSFVVQPPHHIHSCTQRSVHTLIFHRIRTGGEGDVINQNINVSECFICLSLLLLLFRFQSFRSLVVFEIALCICVSVVGFVENIFVFGFVYCVFRIYVRVSSNKSLFDNWQIEFDWAAPALDTLHTENTWWWKKLFSCLFILLNNYEIDS